MFRPIGSGQWIELHSTFEICYGICVRRFRKHPVFTSRDYYKLSQAGDMSKIKTNKKKTEIFRAFAYNYLSDFWTPQHLPRLSELSFPAGASWRIMLIQTSKKNMYTACVSRSFNCSNPRHLFALEVRMFRQREFLEGAFWAFDSINDWYGCFLNIQRRLVYKNL